GAVIGALILFFGWQMGWLRETVPTEDENTPVTITNLPKPATAPSASLSGSAVSSAPVAATSAPSGTTVALPAASVTVAPADAATLRAWIAAQKTPSNDLPGAVAMGASLPLITNIYPIPASAGVPSATKVDYTVVNNIFVLVDPDTYKVLYIFS